MRIPMVVALLAAATGAFAADDLVEIGDNKNFTIGAYLAYMAPFNKGSLVRGTDYDEVMSLRPSTFPDRTRITWRWPATPCPKGIYNFNAIDFGNVNFTVVDKPIPPRRLDQIGELRETHDVDLSGRLGDFDVITDMFVTSKPGDSATKVNEIELFWHTPPYSVYYFNRAEPLGTFTRSGIKWKVAVDRKTKPHDVLVMPVDQRDLLSGTFDVKDILDYLVEQRIVPGDAYFNGMALGVEVRANDGAMNIRKFFVKYM